MPVYLRLASDTVHGGCHGGALLCRALCQYSTWSLLIRMTDQFNWMVSSGCVNPGRWTGCLTVARQTTYRRTARHCRESLLRPYRTV